MFIIYFFVRVILVKILTQRQVSQDIMLHLILIGDITLFSEKLSEFVFNSFCYFDVATKKPEMIYSALDLLSHITFLQG